MLSFFRKIRWRLASDNQFFKYSRYAIGEIVLVVIGIMIALYINNWNEDRKSNKNLIIRLEQIESELILNIEKANRDIESFRVKDSILRNLIYKRYNESDYINDRSLFYVITTTAFPMIQSDFYDNFSNYYLNPGTEVDSIKFKLDRVYGDDKVHLEKVSDLLLEFMMDFSLDMTKTRPWYSELEYSDLRNDQALNYFLKDPIYMNNLMLYHDLAIENVNATLQKFRNNAIKSYKEVYKYLNDVDKTRDEPLLYTYDIQNFKHYLGTYKDSITTSKIYIEDGILMYTYSIGGDTSTAEIIPINRRYFNTYWADGFHYFVFDENGDVEALRWCFQQKGEEYKKVY